MKCILLAAGYGTRLYPVTKDKPKALLEINNKTILNYILDKIESSKKISKVYLVSNNKFFNQFKDFIKKSNYKKEIELVNDETNYEETSLGAFGTLYYALKQKNIDEDVLVIASDNLFDFSLDEFVNYAKLKNRTCIGVYDIKDNNKARSYGVVEVNQDRIIKIEEKPQNPSSTLVSLACYFIRQQDLIYLHNYAKKKVHSQNLGNLIKYLLENISLNAYLIKGKWFDVGNLDEYERAKREF